MTKTVKANPGFELLVWEGEDEYSRYPIVAWNLGEEFITPISIDGTANLDPRSIKAVQYPNGHIHALCSVSGLDGHECEDIEAWLRWVRAENYDRRWLFDEGTSQVASA